MKMKVRNAVTLILASAVISVSAVTALACNEEVYQAVNEANESGFRRVSDLEPFGGPGGPVHNPSLGQAEASQATVEANDAGFIVK